MDWVTNAFTRIATRRRWSWLYDFNQLLVPAQYSTGTVTVTRNSTVVIGSGTAWTSEYVGRQFRTGVNSPIYTITEVSSATQLIIDQVWGGATAAGATYRIYQCFFTVPSDFQSFITIWDPNYNWQLMKDYSQNYLNTVDAQRANSGTAYLIAWRDTLRNSVGVVSQPVQALGSGDAPGSTGTYTGPSDALFTIEITTTGIAGTAEFQWKKGEASYTTGVVTDVGGAAQELQDGVFVFFPADGSVFTDGDVFIIQALAGANPGSPRYEIWPHQTAEYVYPYLYWKRPMSFNASNPILPGSVPSEILLEMALAEAASWPGPSADKANPYYRLELADRHTRKAEFLINELERNDEELFMMDLTYMSSMETPYAPWPWLGDARYLQSHDVG